MRERQDRGIGSHCPQRIHRRDFLKYVAAGAAGAALSGCGPSMRGESAGQKKNVLFISIDDLNDWTGTLGGHPDVRTPNLDRLAQRGTLFANAQCPAPVCGPSRAATMFGIRPARSGIITNIHDMRASPVLADRLTVAEHFKNNGYKTILNGKITHSNDPDPRSWSEMWIEVHKKGRGKLMTHEEVAEWTKRAPFNYGKPLDIGDEETIDGKMVNQCIDFLKRPQEKPFFLTAGFMHPHEIWNSPRKYFEMYPLDEIALPVVNYQDLDDIPPKGREIANPEYYWNRIRQDETQWRHSVQGYLAAISHMDAQLGRLMEAFENSAYAENTTIVLWSDNGFHLGEKMHWQKFTLWEESTRVPMIIVDPLIGRPGQRVEEPVELVDLYPTLTELCGLSTPSGLDGASLVPQLLNPRKETTKPAIISTLYNNYAVRTRRWKYIRYIDGGEELYDHDADPREWTNLAGRPEYRDMIQRLKKYVPGSMPKVPPPEIYGDVDLYQYL